MDRYQSMLRLKAVYEEILHEGDGKLFLEREDEVDHLFLVMQSTDEGPYNKLESDMLKNLSELNHSIECLLIKSMNRMKQVHAMTPKVSKQYDNTGVIESYFYDRKY